MKLKEQNILFLTRTMALGGTENVILQLCEILKPKVNKIIVCSSGGINEEKLKKMNITHIRISDIENKNPINVIKNIKIIKKIIKEENINVIHSHHRMAAMYANLVAGNKVIKVANAHNTFKNKKLFTKLAYRKTKIIAVGEQVKRNLVDFYKINENMVTVIHNAIKEFDGEFVIDKCLQDAKNNGYTIIANVGRLSEQKGMKYFIEASEMVYKNNNMTKFFIIGSGEDEKELKNMVKEKNMLDDIIFLGYRSDIQNIISQVDFVVLSSLWEGLPLTPIETFSMGKTIVATDVDGTPEIVKDNINGFLVDPKDSVNLADKMEKLINDLNIRKKFEKNAKATYNNEFSFAKLSKRYLDFYKKLSEVVK